MPTCRGACAVIVWTVPIFGIVVGLVCLVTSGRLWEQIGRNRLVMDDDEEPQPEAGSAAALRERDAEIRQLLEARNRLRQRRGGVTVDVEQEISRLTAPQVDEGLREEIRQHVIARNHRRSRAGKPALDVEVEVERTIAGLSKL
jgi:hypothetical protein